MKTSMAISVQKTTFQAVAFEESILPGLTLMQELQFDGVELAIRHPDKIDLSRLKTSLADLSLPVPALGTGQAYLEEGLSLSSLDPLVSRQAIERLQSHIRLAQDLKSLVIVGLIRGVLPAETNQRKKAYQAFQENLREVCAAAKKSGVSLVLEPLNRYETNFLNTFEETADCIETLAVDHLGILADTFHMNIEEVNLADSIRRYSSLIRHVHLADSNRWAPGMGHLDFNPVLVSLADSGYDGFYSAEIIPHPNFPAAARKTREFFRGVKAGSQKGRN